MLNKDSHRPVTMRDIAARLGVSGAAVSMALRGLPGVSSETAEKVQAMAREMGWRPNPLVSAYQSQVRAGKPPRVSSAIAWADDMRVIGAGGMEPVRTKMRLAAAAHAKALGYTLEEIAPTGLKVNAFAKNVAIFKRIIEARGITGLVLPIGWRVHHAVADWSPLAIAVIGRIAGLEHSTQPVGNPRVPHSVTSDAFSNALLAIRKLRQAGRRRIGLALSTYHIIGSNENYPAALLLEQQSWPAKERVPVLVLPKTFGPRPPEEFEAWFKKHRPDAVLCRNYEMLGWLGALGRRVPDDVAVAHLDLGPMEPGWSGIDEREEAQAAAAVDLVIGQFGRNERDAPAVPKQVLIQGAWVDGKTV